MILDANSIQNGAELQADVCVVGGGPAGIALTLSLSERGLAVLMLESGQLEEDAKTQSLYEGEVADERLHSPPDKYRQRRLGGSSAIWGGRCMPFDPIDFETRSHVPHSGWPLSYDDLLPYYPQANALAEAGRFSYDAGEAFGPQLEPLIRGFDSPRVRTSGLERFSCPTHFGTRYAKRLQLAPGVQVLLGANCTAVRLQADGQAVRTLEIATLAGKRFTVTPRAAVLAAGGLETAFAAGLARCHTGRRGQLPRRGWPLLHVPHRGQRRHPDRPGPDPQRAARLRGGAGGYLLPPAAVGDSGRAAAAGAGERGRAPALSAHHRPGAPQRRAVGAVSGAQADQL
ncbi:FAD-dependent oxidoreductase [Polaromonas sp. P1(28)-8]|nr:FAD-dependent oxidoreductase [Polaromonas sp. P1(28)-8]